MRVLAIDNDPVVLELLVQLLLENADLDVIAALTAQAALDLLDNPNVPDFDCVLLDLNLAESGGITLVSEIRNRHSDIELPILVLTAMAEKQAIDAAFLAGTTDFMTKPFEINALHGRLALLTGAAGLESQCPENAPPTLSDPVPLNAALKMIDVKVFIENAALENYAKQLSRSTLYGSSAFAFGIRDVSDLHAKLSPFDFHCMVNDVASAIANEMQDCQTLMTYVGNGIFVGIAESTWRPQTEKVMNRVNMGLGSTEICDGDGTLLDVRISAGHATRLTWKSGASVLDALRYAERSAVTACAAYRKLRDEFWFMEHSA